MITAEDLSTVSGTSAVIAARFLTPVVRSTQALAVNAKQAHWNVRGTNFLTIHELLDVVATNARDAADTAAERVVALGLAIDARLHTIAEVTPPTTVSAGFSSWDDTVRAVVADIDDAIAHAERAITGLDGEDLPSQDIAIGIEATLERDRWLLSAHLSS